ncbi:MAG TPA: hypothetical protein VLF89_03420 [Candidatus Saccharimonadales bacterium]|nr:hypothetical protein [Candidatus Saccharimonadales bacterium]
MQKREMLPVIPYETALQWQAISVDLENDKPKDECGVFGFQFSSDMQVLHPEYAEKLPYILFDGMHQNQNRGESSAGIAVVHNGEVFEYKGLGLVSVLYKKYDDAVKTENTETKNLHGYGGIGHNRYPTTGAKRDAEGLKNAGPFTEYNKDLGPVAVAHNGNIINAKELRRQLIDRGYILDATTDSQVIAAVIADAPGETWEEKAAFGLRKLKGSFSLVFKTLNGLLAARDTSGNKPLFMARFAAGVAFSSETPALSRYTSEFEEIAPGEIVSYSGREVIKYTYANVTERRMCAIDYIYLENEAGEGVDSLRRLQGNMLAREYPMPKGPSYVVSFLPNSGEIFAQGYAEALSQQLGEYIPPQRILLKNRYGMLNGQNKGFIQPDQEDRSSMSYFALDLLKELKQRSLSGENIELILLDDSIVRGTTLRKTIHQIRQFVGNIKIHLRIALFPISEECPFGVDIAKEQGLIFDKCNKNKEEVARSLGVDSLEYSTVEQLETSVQTVFGADRHVCSGCHDRNYSQLIYQSA